MNWTTDILNILMLAAVTVFVVDLSGFTATWKGWLGKWLGVEIGPVPPFDCSLCMTFWVGVGYMLFAHCFSIPMLCFVTLLSFCSSLMGEMLTAIRELFKALVRLLWKIIDKIK